MKTLTRMIYRRGLDRVERGEFDTLLRDFDRRCHFRFVGDSPLGADLSSREEIRLWFDRFRRLLPDPRFEVQVAMVVGPPWRQRVAAHVLIRSTVDGEPYENQFAQFLTLRWGKVTDDLVLEDTQMWERACRQLIDAGVDEASELPMLSSPTQV